MSRKQKRIAVVNDVTGFGRCSAAVALPIISAMKSQCCVLPTSILSAHTAWPGYVFDDYTDKMKLHMENWSELGLEFDGIATGFLGSARQIDIIIDFVKRFGTGSTVVLVDPVMGDNGKLYSTYTKEMCREMKKLVSIADVVTPNLTEACYLLDIPYSTRNMSESELQRIAKGISDMGPDRVVITGIERNDELVNFAYEKGREFIVLSSKKIGEYRSGTGDIFSAVVVGSLVRGNSFASSVQMAIDYINKCIKYTIESGAGIHEGLCFEEYLGDLAK
ncbi:MAG: pyridoxamine kinase [Eubacterium sp.]